MTTPNSLLTLYSTSPNDTSKWRLTDQDKETQKTRKIPEVTEKMVADMMIAVHKILDNTEPKELKVALGHFIDRIELRGNDIEISYVSDMGENLSYQWRPRGASGSNVQYTIYIVSEDMDNSIQNIHPDSGVFSYESPLSVSLS
jgi:hypothetical protein